MQFFAGALKKARPVPKMEKRMLRLKKPNPVLSIIKCLLLLIAIGLLLCDPALRLKYYAINETNDILTIKYSIPKYDYNTKKDFHSDTSIILKPKDTMEIYSQNRIGTIAQAKKYCDIITDMKIYFQDSLVQGKKLTCDELKVDTLEKYPSTGGKIDYTIRIKN